jgi:hypothetical protein
MVILGRRFGSEEDQKDPGFPPQPGTDVIIFKIFSRKKSRKIGVFTQTTASFARN